MEQDTHKVPGIPVTETPLQRSPLVFPNGTDDPGDLTQLRAAAHAATVYEHELTFWHAMKLYPKAVLFSLGLSLAIIMEGYDNSLMNSLYGLPQFRQRYGQRLANGDYQVSYGWQSGIAVFGSVSGILGLLFAGWLVEKIGYRHTMFIGLVLLSGAIFVLFYANSILMLFFGIFLCGFPWGLFQPVASAYAADISPLVLRPLLTSYIKLCWSFGGLIATGVLRSFLHRTDEWAYRLPFAIQWVWPIPIAIITFFAPESPWLLVRQGRAQEARSVLRRLASDEVTDAQVDNTIAMMYITNEHERKMAKTGTYRETFMDTNLRRTEVAIGATICQITCGSWFGGNSPYFMEQAGASPSTAFAVGLGTGGMTCIGTVLSWFAMRHLGRRTLFLWGLSCILLTLLLVGCLGIPNSTAPAIQWASGALLICLNLFYAVTIGSVAFTIAPEVPSVRLRSKTFVITRSAFNVAGIMASFLNPALLNPTAWNLKQKGAFVWSGFCVLSLAWAFLRLPETKGRTPHELDALFERRTKTREFSKARVEVFDTDDSSSVGALAGESRA